MLRIIVSIIAVIHATPLLLIVVFFTSLVFDKDIIGNAIFIGFGN